MVHDFTDDQWWLGWQAICTSGCGYKVIPGLGSIGVASQCHVLFLALEADSIRHPGRPAGRQIGQQYFFAGLVQAEAVIGWTVEIPDLVKVDPTRASDRVRARDPPLHQVISIITEIPVGEAECSRSGVIDFNAVIGVVVGKSRV